MGGKSEPQHHNILPFKIFTIKIILCPEVQQGHNAVKYLEKVHCKLYTSVHKEGKLIFSVQTLSTLFSAFKSFLI